MQIVSNARKEVNEDVLSSWVVGRVELRDLCEKGGEGGRASLVKCQNCGHGGSCQGRERVFRERIAKAGGETDLFGKLVVF